MKDPCIQTFQGEYIVAVKFNGVTVISCYCSPNTNIRCYENMLDEITDVIQTTCRAIIGGDFNAKSEAWGSGYTNRRGELKEEWAATYDENN